MHRLIINQLIIYLWIYIFLPQLCISQLQQNDIFSRNPQNENPFENPFERTSTIGYYNNQQQDDSDNFYFRNDNNDRNTNFGGGISGSNINSAGGGIGSNTGRTTYYQRSGSGGSFSGLYDNKIVRQPTYFIVGSKMVRPGLVYKLLVSVLLAQYPITVHASISRNGVEISADKKDVREGVPETLLMRIPPTSVVGEYKIRIEGLYNDILGGIAFWNETALNFSQRSMTIYIQTDKPLYMQGETVRFRTVPITTELKGFDNAVDVFMLDPNKYIVRRWLSRQSNLGSVSLSYKLSDQPVFGEWTIRVMVLGQIEEGHFTVEEYYQTRFEVNVTMPAFFQTTDPFIYGKIMANFTSGAPVSGNLTLKAIIRPVGFLDIETINERYRVGDAYSWNRRRYREHRYGLGETQQYGFGGAQQYGGGYYDGNYENVNAHNQFTGSGGQFPSEIHPDGNQFYGGGSFHDSFRFEKYFEFDEEWPFWIRKPEGQQVYDHLTGTYHNALPYLRFFNGTYDFKYPMDELRSLIPNVDGIEIMIVATVGEKFYDEILSGYSIARIYNSSIKLQFLGDTTQVFKPAMPFNCYLAVSYHDGSPVDPNYLYQSTMEIHGTVERRNGERRDYPTRRIAMSTEKTGVWELGIDLLNDLELYGKKNGMEFLNDIQTMRLQANFIDGRGELARAELILVSHQSPSNQQIKVSTSTRDAKVGEYIIFHIRTNFFIETFDYLIVSKGIVLQTGQEHITEGIRTMAVTLSAEMAPVATIIVWKVTQRGHTVVDSLTFAVNGISRNNFTVYINNRKARTGEKVEVAIYGEPGAFVALSGIDTAFYTMQAGNELTYANVITKMSKFDGDETSTHQHTWHSHEGIPEDLVYFPSSTSGIDANRTFEYAGLIVFTDAIVPRRQDNCNLTLGFGECLNSRCYRVEKRCDGYFDCEDGTDERNCQVGTMAYNRTSLRHYRMYRFNRIKRHYENVWLWKDINIGPHGRYIFNIDVPDRPAFWLVSSFSVSPSKGFGLLSKAIEYVGVQPFFINVEMPSECRQGEQVGIRVTVFNYMTTSIESTVVLHGSPDYKFVHVEEDGIVRSYNPRTSFGEHHFFIYLEAQQTSVVYIPIVPQRLGAIDVTLHAETLLGTDQITRRLFVESDGLPQHRHQSILLDLSNRAYILQYMHVNITETPIIPYHVERYFVFGSNRARISVVGDVVGPIFPTMPVNATSLIYMPMECGEQNMFSFAANLYTIMYMRLINQRNRTLEKDAFYHMNVAYQRQLSYMKEDGSFSIFRSDWNNSASSVWLTAYCARIFQEASFYEWENYIFIDPRIIQRSVRWLLQHQTNEGSFYEITWLPDRKMNGSMRLRDEHIKYRNISLTAHVLITLATVKDLSGSLGARVALAQQRAILWIERNMKYLKDTVEPYEVAIVTYALMLSRASSAEHVFGILAKHARVAGEYTYWGNIDVPQPPSKLENQKWFSLPRLPYEYDSLNIETTAYALLVYVSRREFFIEPIVRWLISQRLHDGGWASTQDTSVALKALVDYTVHSRLREVSSLTVSVEATSLQGEIKTFYINDNNLAQLQSIEIPNAWGTVKVQAKGAGFAILQMHVQYNVDSEQFQTKPPLSAFDLRTRAIFHGRNQSHISYLSCQRWIHQNESQRSGMAVLDVAIPTGYFIQQQKLDHYVLTKRVRNLQRAKYFEKKVLFYFEFLDDEDVCVNFTVERWYPVANMSRYLPIRVYDYYAPERFNETIFDALPTYLLNICEVCGSSQCPYCSIYNNAIKMTIHLVLIFINVFVVCIYNRFTV